MAATRTHNRLSKVATGTLASTIGFGSLALGLISCQPNSVKQELKPEQIAQYSKPGTVLVQANHKIEFSYPKPVLNQEKRGQLIEEVRQKYQQGEIRSEADAMVYIVREVLKRPTEFMQPGERLSGRAEVPMVGTGFILTSDGTVATAAHVVSNTTKKVKSELGKTALGQVTTDYCSQQLKTFSPEQRSMLETKISPKELMRLCLDGFVDYYAKNLAIDKVQTDTAVVMQPANPSQGNSWRTIPSQIKKIGQSIPAEDVALLKIPGNNFPTVAIAEAQSIDTGSTIYSLGYPAAVTRLFAKTSDSKDANTAPKLTQLPEPTLAAGSVSALNQPLPDGDGQMLQANVAISPGNSGGPLFNKKGEVVGVASFVSVNEQGEQVQGASFFVPIEVLKRQLKEQNITPEPNVLMQRYEEALELFNQKQYRKSLKMFEEIRNTNPDFPNIQQLISKAQNESKNEGFSIPEWAYGAAASAIVVLALGGTGVFWFTRKARSRATAAPIATPVSIEK